MINATKAAWIRQQMGLSQEQMARLLGVSFASVNRWEGGHSAPIAPIQDLYLAIEAAICAGNSPDAICRAANNERSAFLYTLFRMAYAQRQRRAR